MKKQIIILIGCMVLGVAILFSLFALSPFTAPIPRHSFVRNFDDKIHLFKTGEIDLKWNSFYFAGASKNIIYLGNWTAPFHLVQVSVPKLDTIHTNLSIKEIELPEDYRTFRLKVDSPYFYLGHGVMPGIFKGHLNEHNATRFSSKHSPYFVDAVPISPNSIALKSMSAESKSNELAQLKLDSPYFEFKPDALEKQIDGVFCVDGILLYDKPTSQLVYVYVYRNEYIVMDTALSVTGRHHTIDTFSRAPIKVADVSSQNYRTLASPPARTNLKSCLSKNLLFVESPLLAKNENIIEFQNSSTIDVYDIKKGQYKYSFHLNFLNNQRMSSFFVLNEYLVTIYDHQLIVYEMNLPKEPILPINPFGI